MERSRARAAVVEVAVVAAVALVFVLAHGAAGTDVAAATANAEALQSVERALGLDVELAVNRWLVTHDALVPLAVVVYRAHHAVTAGVLVWTFWRHPAPYLRARRTLVALTLLVLPVFWAVPMSPPRFALPGTTDVIAAHDPVAGAASVDPDSGANHYSAMPSLHVGWAAWCAYAVWSALRPAHPRLALLAWLYPAVMVADVLATGNHYVLDVVASAVLLAVAVGVARLWATVRATVRATD